MWWFEAIADGFRQPYASMQVCAFRVVLAAAMLFKFGYEHRRGGWRYFAPGSFIAYRFRQEHPDLPIDQTRYRMLYVAKVAAAVLLLLGIAPRVAAVVAGIWFLFELTYDRKYHTAYLGLCSVLLAFSPALGDALTFRTVLAAFDSPIATVLAAEAARTRVDIFAQVLVVLLTVQMYLSSAYRKLRSEHFVSGAALHDFAGSLHRDRYAQRYRDTWYPSLMVRHLIDVPPPVAKQRWRGPAMATIAAEFLLPVALLVSFTYPVAVVFGALMHAAFTALLPVRLVPFSLAAVGSYLLFAEPAAVLAWLS